MKPLQRAIVPQSEIELVIADQHNCGMILTPDLHREIETTALWKGDGLTQRSERKTMNQRDGTRRKSKCLWAGKKQFPQHPLVRTLPETTSARVPTGGRLLRGLPFLALKIDARVYSQLILDKRIPHGAFRLWHLLRDYASDQGVAWPSVRTIMEDMSCDYRSFSSWIAALVTWNYIEVIPGNRSRSNRYSFKKFLAQEVSVKLQTQVTVKTQTGCLENYMQKLPQYPNPKEEGRHPPDSLSKADVITLQDELKRVQKRLSELQGDLINDRLTQERKDLRGYEAKLISKVRNYTEQLCRS